MDFLSSVRRAIHDTIGHSDRPIAVFSSAWPFMRELRQSNVAAIEALLDVLLETAGKRTLLMPTFARGFIDGVCDLDEEISATGALSECFRKRPGTRRTLSAFFPFAVSGPDIDEVINLKPSRAWGEGSLYEWMELRNVCFLMLGTHPTQCSYLHRLEWLVRDLIDYRFDKTFGGTLIREGETMYIEETLYVRRLDPPADNDFTVLLPFLKRAGMRSVAPNGVSIASYDAEAVVAEIVPTLRREPRFLLVNPNGQEQCGQ